MVYFPVELSLLSLELIRVLPIPSSSRLLRKRAGASECSAPKGKAVEEWIKKWAQNVHKLKLAPPQVGFVLDRVGTEFGLLDQELAKAALYSEGDGTITDQQLKLAIGSWRTQTVWEIVSATLERPHSYGARATSQGRASR